MKELLVPPNTAALQRFAQHKALLAFDFDGTLAPIVTQRDHAQMRDHTRDLFAQLGDLYPCAVISGRSQTDVAARLGHASAKYVVGNHGAEPSVGQAEYEVETQHARQQLEAQLSSVPGVDVENKRYSLAIHYRKSTQRTLARHAITSAVSKLSVPLRVIPGKLVINVVPQRAPNKGDALLELRRAEGADFVLYVGDDVTDEDVFQLRPQSEIVSVRVGESQRSSAQYFLREQRDIDRLLELLILLRKGHPGPTGANAGPARL